MLRALAVAIFAFSSSSAVADPVLLMAEEDGCMWCARWHEEIGPIYPKTAEAGIAPLQSYDLHSDQPDVAFERRVLFTPTFILVDEGKELGRIEGYPGEDLFWGLLSMMFEQSGLSLEKEG